ncbi:hypothetical protein [Piscinibacter koreensis]
MSGTVKTCVEGKLTTLPPQAAEQAEPHASPPATVPSASNEVDMPISVKA